MKEISIASFRDIVEVGLQEHFGRDGKYSEYAGKMSIHPDRVGSDVTSEALEFRCEDFSHEFRHVGKKLGLDIHLAMTDQGHDEHVYLVPDESHGLSDVVVDLTVGQYVEGHNNVFVGSREALRDIVVLQAGPGKQYALVEPSELIEPEEIELYREPTKFFQRKWGNGSIVLGAENTIRTEPNVGQSVARNITSHEADIKDRATHINRCKTK